MFHRKLPSSQESVAPQFKKCACPVGVRTESNHVGLARLVTGTRARSRAIGMDRPTSHSTAVQTCCSDGLMSFPFAPRAILIISASVDTELCVQQDSPYCGMCWFRFSVQWFTPSLLHLVKSFDRPSAMTVLSTAKGNPMLLHHHSHPTGHKQ